MPENFNQPYLASSITDFWRRWHISLSSWLRDYLYIPLGGNRKGKLNTYRNLFLTMFLGGLWHGANWTFMAWGTLHGLYLAAHKLFSEHRHPRKTKDSFPVKAVKVLLTFQLVTLTWILFRAANFHEAHTYLAGVLSLRPGVDHALLIKIIFYLAIILALDGPQYLSGSHTIMLRWHWAWRGLFYAIMVFMLCICRSGHAYPFIYFQF